MKPYLYLDKIIPDGNTSGVQKSLEAKFSAIFPTWPTMIATIIALLIILIILTKLVYKPVQKMNANRRNYIQNNINAAEKQNKIASFDREEANKELVAAYVQANKIILNAEVAAEEVKAHKIANAKKQAQILISSAKKDIEAQQSKFDQESEEAIVEVALAAAAKVVEKEVDNETNKKIIKNFIKENK